MTRGGLYDEVILDKAVRLASKNGWDGDIERSGYSPLIFNKDFARALFGDKWEKHLQQMVIAADPIQYLSEHMP